MDLKREAFGLEDYRKHYETTLNQVFFDYEVPCKQLKAAMLYSLFPAGKRIRPLLVYLSGEILGVERQSLDYIAIAVELMHSYSLIHDDLPAMDDDAWRRGRASCHKAFDEATAILAGDAIQALSFEVLLNYLPERLLPKQVLSILSILAKAAGAQGMVSGQSLDLLELNRPDLSLEALSGIHRLKTGALISACIEMVVAAGSDLQENNFNAIPVEKALPADFELRASFEKKAAALRRYARHLGLVFQMQDDYLDRYGDHILGKGRSSDEMNDKRTFAYFYSKEALLNLITEQFEEAKVALASCGQMARNLVALTEELAFRSVKIISF